jgi:lipopolysaccharide transport system ATP-binding protein
VDHFNDHQAAEYVRATEPNPSSVAVLRLAICNAKGAIASQIELTEDFFVEVDYLLGTPMSGLSVGLQVILDDGLLTMLSLSDPEFAPERLNMRPAGRYKARVKIPRQILNTGRYRLRVGISSRFSVYDIVENVTFEVVDNVGIVQFMGWDRKGSLLGVQLPWDVERA